MTDSNGANGHAYSDAEKAFLLSTRLPDIHDMGRLAELAARFNTRFGTDVSPKALYAKAVQLRKQRSSGNNGRHIHGNGKKAPRTKKRSSRHRAFATH